MFKKSINLSVLSIFVIIVTTSNNLYAKEEKPNVNVVKEEKSNTNDDAFAKKYKSKIAVGVIEKIAILPKGLVYTAKVDTGATNSSMHATDIEMYEKDGKRFVRFRTEDSNGRHESLNLPLKRVARIKQHGGKKALERPVTEVGICLDSIYKTVQVTLTDRSTFSYPFLVGASYLKGSFVVDVDIKFGAKPNCDLVSVNK